MNKNPKLLERGPVRAYPMECGSTALSRSIPHVESICSLPFAHRGWHQSEDGASWTNRAEICDSSAEYDSPDTRGLRMANLLEDLHKDHVGCPAYVTEEAVGMLRELAQKYRQALHAYVETAASE